MVEAMHSNHDLKRERDAEKADWSESSSDERLLSLIIKSYRIPILYVTVSMTNISDNEEGIVNGSDRDQGTVNGSNRYQDIVAVAVIVIVGVKYCHQQFWKD